MSKKTTNWTLDDLKNKNLVPSGKDSFIPSNKANTTHFGQTKVVSPVTTNPYVDPSNYIECLPPGQIRISKGNMHDVVAGAGIPLSWFIPYQVPSKKNCQQLYVTYRNGKPVPATTTSKRYKDYVTATKKYWEVFGIEFRETVKKLALAYPLRVKFTFVRSTKQEVDYVGPLESVQDIMQDFNWLPKDDYKHMKPVLGDMEVDKNNPGVRIIILPHHEHI